ncbi:MAG: hypothetical protein LKI88_02740 [Bifidobacterium sp.]|jgi:quinol-cytochrome oxidoreductase complex cytochrome b subunit|nr:hypothetical protein [Bifidobacterium sp.]MCI1864837.1 hypothetical protein [Bifidobacterium sp.]
MATSEKAEESALHKEEPQKEYLSDAEKQDAVRSARRNDLRLILGGLFTVYGVIVTIVGLVNPAADVAKTGGIAINLWSGIIMLLVGLGFLLWNRLRPLPKDDIIASAEMSAAQAATEHEHLK